MQSAESSVKHLSEVVADFRIVIFRHFWSRIFRNGQPIPIL